MLQNNLQYMLAKITLFNIDNKNKTKKGKKGKKGKKEKMLQNFKLKYA